MFIEISNFFLWIVIFCLIILTYKLYKRLNKHDISINYIYVRKIFKTIINKLFEKYKNKGCIHVGKNKNYFYFNFIPKNNELSNDNAIKLNNFKEKFYNFYYKRFNSYVHLDYTNVPNGINFIENIKIDEDSVKMLNNCVNLLFTQKYINEEEKVLIFNELYSIDFNIFKADEELQKKLKKLYKH